LRKHKHLRSSQLSYGKSPPQTHLHLALEKHSSPNPTRQCQLSPRTPPLSGAQYFHFSHPCRRGVHPHPIRAIWPSAFCPRLLRCLRSLRYHPLTPFCPRHPPPSSKRDGGVEIHRRCAYLNLAIEDQCCLETLAVTTPSADLMTGSVDFIQLELLFGPDALTKTRAQQHD
jgi:hypothetical protein